LGVAIAFGAVAALLETGTAAIPPGPPVSGFLAALACLALAYRFPLWPMGGLGGGSIVVGAVWATAPLGGLLGIPVLMAFALGVSLRSARVAHEASERRARTLAELTLRLREALSSSDALAVGRERSRISSQLHDHLGHELTTAHVWIDYLWSRPTSPITTEELTRIRQALESCLQALRDTVRALQVSSDASLAQRIGALCERLPSDVLTVSVSVVNAPLFQPSADLLTVAIQEGLTNVLRHSYARSCRVDVQLVGERQMFEVTDEGPVRLPTVDGSGVGLSGLKARFEQAGGTLHWGPMGRGFRLAGELKGNT
jgi:two-component system sensor histidine kinase DesK